MPSPNVNSDLYSQFLLCEWKKKLDEEIIHSQKEKLEINNHYCELLKQTLNSKQKKTNKHGVGLEQKMVVPSIDVSTYIDGVKIDSSLSDSSSMSKPIQMKKKFTSYIKEKINQSATEKKKKCRIINESSDEDSVENTNGSVLNDTSDDNSSTNLMSNLKNKFKKGISKLKKINQSKTKKNETKEKISTNEKVINTHTQETQPNGDLKYLVKKQYSLSDGKVLPLILDWKFCTHNSRICNGLKKRYKYCLGVFKCEFCDFVACPLQPSAKKKFKAPPASKAQCPTHLCNLAHIACKCTVVLTDLGN